MLVVFGSAATEAKKPDDIDIAVFLNETSRALAETDYARQHEILLTLGELLKESPDRIDMVLISPKISPLLQYHIARDGELLFGSENDFMRFRLLAIKVYWDTEKFREALWPYLKKAYAR